MPRDRHLTVLPHVWRHEQFHARHQQLQCRREQTIGAPDPAVQLQFLLLVQPFVKDRSTLSYNTTYVQVRLASLVPLNGLFARLVPRDTVDIDRRDTRYQPQRHSRSSPKTVQIPMQAEPETE